MRKLLALLVAMFSVAGVAQDEPKPILSAKPLTAEQVAVYRAVLADYLKDGDDRSLNIANKTEPLDPSGCIDGRKQTAPSRVLLEIHTLDPSVILGFKVVLVDPDKQTALVKENDPGKLIKKVIDQHEEVSDKQLEDSVDRAFSTGLFTLSEIAFDKEHRRAVVAYSFVCGGLCGHGNTLVLTKVKDKWKIKKTCDGWIS
jgi:hypothetical protein